MFSPASAHVMRLIILSGCESRVRMSNCVLQTTGGKGCHSRTGPHLSAFSARAQAFSQVFLGLLSAPGALHSLSWIDIGQSVQKTIQFNPTVSNALAHLSGSEKAFSAIVTKCCSGLLGADGIKTQISHSLLLREQFGTWFPRIPGENRETAAYCRT